MSDETLVSGDLTVLFRAVLGHFPTGVTVVATVDDDRPVGLAVGSFFSLFAFCRERLAPYKAPTIWVTVEEFPTTASGKIQKFTFRDHLSAGAYPSVWRRPS